MIAALGMYDLPPLQEANDRFWLHIRAELGRGPEQLTRDRDAWDVWQSSDLMLAQTCGYPYRAKLHGSVNLVGTPDYGLPDCPPGYYRSVLVVRADDPRQSEDAFAGACFAYNEALSQSGWAAPQVHLSARGIPMGDLIETGAHAASARAVAEGRADLAGLDALTWELLKRHDPVAQDLRVISETVPTPGLPYITSLNEDGEIIVKAVAAAIAALGADDRAALHLKGLIQIPAEAYLAIPTPPPPDE